MKKIIPLFVLIAILNTAAGYVGELPDVNKIFAVKQKEMQQQQQQSEERFRPLIDVEKDLIHDVEPKIDSPKYNKYLMQTNPYATYLVDIMNFKDLLNDLSESSKKEDLQTFAAKSYYFTLKANQFLKKYRNKPEEKYISYKVMQELTRQSNEIVKIWQKSNYTLQYVSYRTYNGKYTRENINKNLECLRENIGILQEQIKLLSE